MIFLKQCHFKYKNCIRDNIKGQSDPYVFICTTLWQENEQEMEVLLRSLTRLANHLGLVVILFQTEIFS